MSEGTRLRILVIGAIVVALFSSLFARLWYLQIISGDRYAVAAEENRVRVVAREAPRGRILDRRGRVLVDNRVANVVSVSRSLAGEERERVIAELARLLRLPVETIEERMSDQRFADFRPIPVATEVDEPTLLAIREREDELPGVEARQVAIRRYPEGHLAAHLLGYVGEINDQELEDRHQEGYQLGNQIGKVGVERAYETDLRGLRGLDSYEVDRRGEVLRQLAEKEAQQGNDVQLGIDRDVQAAAEAALEDHILRSRENELAATGGAVVAMDVETGSVVAMASYPTYEPERFVHGIRTELWEELNDPENNLPLNNRAVQGLYPAASTFKIVTGIAGITSGVLTLGETVVDEGAVEIGDRFFSNAGSRAYGRVDLRRAVTVSSDVFFYLLGFEINGLSGEAQTEIQRVARMFGFGDPTGVELPFEQEGRVPDPDWKRQVNAVNPEAFPVGRWYAGDNVNLAIGQGDLLVTPLQLANAYAALANGGSVHKPRVGMQVVDRFGSVRRTVQPEVLRRVPIDPAVRDTILAGMRGVTAVEEGTAYQAFRGYSGPPVAGKTGTAQVRNKDDTSLFVGLVPAGNPRYVVAAVVEEAGAGSAVAAPVVRRVIEALNATEADPDLPPIGTVPSHDGIG